MRVFKYLLTFLFFLNCAFGAENKPQIKVISLAPAVTETLFYFGYGDNLLGRTDYCSFPQESARIESMGSMFSPNIEKIVYLKPDYLIFQSHFDKRLKKQVEDMGLMTLAFPTPKSIDEILTQYAAILSIFNEVPDKNLKFSEIKDNIEMIKNNSKKIERKPTVYYSLGSGHIEYTSGKGSFIDDAITLAGGRNIVDDEGWSYPLEALIAKQPDIIIISKEKYNAMVNNKKYEQLEALKNEKRVIFIEDDEITTATPRLLLKTLNKIQKGILDFNSIN